MKKDKNKVFVVICPVCQSGLWIDSASREVIRSEKGKRKKGSLDELLAEEKKRKSGFTRKFEATAALEREKRKKAQEDFEKAFSKVDTES